MLARCKTQFEALNIDLCKLSVGASKMHVYMLYFVLVFFYHSEGNLINMLSSPSCELLMVVLEMMLFINFAVVEKTEVKVDKDFLCD